MPPVDENPAGGGQVAIRIDESQANGATVRDALAICLRPQRRTNCVHFGHVCGIETCVLTALAKRASRLSGRVRYRVRVNLQICLST